MVSGSSTNNQGRLHGSDLVERIRIGGLLLVNAPSSAAKSSREPVGRSPTRTSSNHKGNGLGTSEQSRDHSPSLGKKQLQEQSESFSQRTKRTTFKVPLPPSLGDSNNTTTSMDETERRTNYSVLDLQRTRNTNDNTNLQSRSRTSKKEDGKSSSPGSQSLRTRRVGSASSPNNLIREERGPTSSTLRQGEMQAASSLPPSRSPEPRTENPSRPSSLGRQGRNVVARSPSPFSRSGQRATGTVSHAGSPFSFRQGTTSTGTAMPSPARRGRSPSPFSHSSRRTTGTVSPSWYPSSLRQERKSTSTATSSPTRRGRSPSPFSQSSRRETRTVSRPQTPSLERQGRNSVGPSSRRGWSPSLVRRGKNTAAAPSPPGQRGRSPSPHRASSRADDAKTPSRPRTPSFLRPSLSFSSTNRRSSLKINTRSRSPSKDVPQKSTNSHTPSIRRGRSPAPFSSSSSQRGERSNLRSRSPSMVRKGPKMNATHQPQSRVRPPSRSRSPFPRQPQKTATASSRSLSPKRKLNSASPVDAQGSSTKTSTGNGILRPSRYVEKKNTSRTNSSSRRSQTSNQRSEPKEAYATNRSQSAGRLRTFNWWNSAKSEAKDDTEIVVNIKNSDSADDPDFLDAAGDVQEIEVIAPHRSVPDSSPRQSKTSQGLIHTSAPKLQVEGESADTCKPKRTISFRRMVFVKNGASKKSRRHLSKSISKADAAVDSSTFISDTTGTHDSLIRSFSETANRLSDISGKDRSMLEIIKSIEALEHRVGDESKPRFSPEEMGEILSALSKLRAYAAHRRGTYSTKDVASMQSASSYFKADFWLDKLTTSVFGETPFFEEWLDRLQQQGGHHSFDDTTGQRLM